jgi:DNA-binding response OmpR family regulator
MSNANDRGTHTVLVFSQDPAVREQLRTAVGRRPARDVGRVEYVEADTGEEVMASIDAGGIDLAVLDGEAQPTGGMGLARTIALEVADPPLMCVLIRRRDDRWLATWSRADATIMYPIDAVEAAQTVAGLLRQTATVR